MTKLVYQLSKGAFVKGLHVGYKTDEITGNVSTYIDTVVTKSLEEASDWTSLRTDDFNILVFCQDVDWLFPGVPSKIDVMDFVVLTYHEDNKISREICDGEL